MWDSILTNFKSSKNQNSLIIEFKTWQSWEITFFKYFIYINIQENNFQITLYGQKNYDSTMKKSLRLHYEEFSINQKPKHLDYLIQHIKRVGNHSPQYFTYFNIHENHFHVTFKWHKNMLHMWKLQWDSIMKNLHLTKSKNTLMDGFSTS